jgi:hypothetical protein
MAQMSALQAWNLEFKPQFQQKTKKEKENKERKKVLGSPKSKNLSSAKKSTLD